MDKMIPQTRVATKKKVVIMEKPLSELSVNGKIHFALIKTATTLTGRDFLKLTEITNQAHGEIHIIHGSWQVLIGFQ